nr:TPA_asm: hypothetical protein [Becan tricladivirus 3]
MIYYNVLLLDFMHYTELQEFHTIRGVFKLFVISALKLLRIGFKRTFGFISGIVGSYFFYYISKPNSNQLLCYPIKYSYQFCEAIFNITKD